MGEIETGTEIRTGTEKNDLLDRGPLVDLTPAPSHHGGITNMAETEIIHKEEVNTIDMAQKGRSNFPSDIFKKRKVKCCFRICTKN